MSNGNPSVRRVVAGVAMMVLCGAIFTAFAAAAAAPSQEEQYTAAAEAAAGSWLALADAGNYSRSWDQAADIFQASISKENWMSRLQRARGPLGGLVSRKVKSARYADSLPGAPDGDYFVIQYQTQFENKKSAIETVTPHREKDGSWKVSGYFIK